MNVEQVEVGQVYKDLNDAGKRTVKVGQIIDDGERCEAVIMDGEGNSGKTIRLKTEKLTGPNWRLLRNADGTVPGSGLDDAFAAVNEREADEMNQLVLFGTPEFMVDSVGLSKHGSITVGGTQRTLEVLLKIHQAVQLWIGDLINVAERTFGEEASQIIDQQTFENAGLSESSVKTYAWVASRVSDSVRRIAQSFGHCQAVAALREDQQRKFLEESRANDWSVSKLKVEVASRTEEGRSKLRFLLIIDAGTETKQEKLRTELEGQGFKVTTRQSVKREKKEKKPRAKKEVTARARKAAPKASTRRRKS